MTKKSQKFDDIYFGKMENALDTIFNDEDEMRKPIKVYNNKNTNPINSHTVSSLAHSTPLSSPLINSKALGTKELSVKNDQFNSYKQTP